MSEMSIDSPSNDYSENRALETEGESTKHSELKKKERKKNLSALNFKV